MRKLIPLLALGGIAAACSYAPAPMGLPDPYGQARLADLLAGKAVAGAPKRCLPSYQTSDLIPVDANHVIYRAGSTMYLSTMKGSCEGLRSGYTLVTRPFGFSGPCADDVAYVVDPTSGMTMGSCLFGDFVPYKKVR